MTDESIKDVFPVLNDPALVRVAADLKQMQRAAIRIHATLAEEHTLPVGTSKLGGSPDLPLNTSWPVKRLRVPPPSEGFQRTHPELPFLPADGAVALLFIAQFNCSELAPYDLDNRLPASGMLYFFLQSPRLLFRCGRQRRQRSRPSFWLCL